MLTPRIGFAAMVVAVTATSAWAQSYYVRGDFNGWQPTDQMTEVTTTHYTHTITAQPAGALQEYKITVLDWSLTWPGSNGRVAVDALGEINFHFYPKTFADGWSPAQDRVGYEDSGQHRWDIMGSVNGWAGPVVALRDTGGGLYSGQAVVTAPGVHQFKFRKDGDWAITIGDDFGISALNISVETTVVDQEILFELDLPNGRWRVSPPPLFADGFESGNTSAWSSTVPP